MLALLKPDILPAVRDAYSELVAEGIMSKKRMKFYFASLPGRTSVKIASDVNFDLPGRTSASVTHDLSEYAPVSLRHPSASDTSMMKPVNVEDIEASLSEMLPLVSTTCPDKTLLFERLWLMIVRLCLVRSPARRTSQLLYLASVQDT